MLRISGIRARRASFAPFSDPSRIIFLLHQVHLKKFSVISLIFCVHVCVWVYSYIYIYVCVYIYIHIFMYLYICVYMYY